MATREMENGVPRALREPARRMPAARPGACWPWALLVLLAAGRVGVAQVTQPCSSPAGASAAGMTFLFHADPAFLEGLSRHGLLRDDHGYRVHNTGLDTRPFGERWIGSPLLEKARRSGKPYYIDRIAGGMPFQSLKGIEQVAAGLKDDPRFLGFQLHEWGNSPVRDNRKVEELLLKKGLPFDREHFRQYEGRVAETPQFGGGDFSIYEHIHRPLKTHRDVERYLEDYFRRMSELANGQVMAVNGYYQLYHMGLKLGAKNVMAEIGNQVPLTALQIACVRGAARQHGKPFGVYYEPWGGVPFGCQCAIGWSPWFPGGENPDNKWVGSRIRPGLGSSRSLQRRLLYYAWLSGASWCAEEWGVENYFSNWKDYPLTGYGQVVREFIDVTSAFGRARPIVPAALVLPPGASVIDIRYVAAQKEQVYDTMEPDESHVRLRQFARDVLGARPYKYGQDDFNLTPSPWIGCFDVLSAEAPADLLAQYGLRVYFSDDQAGLAGASGPPRIVYRGEAGDGPACVNALRSLLPLRVEGRAGSMQAYAGGFHLVGVFNNLGVTKREGRETADPGATQRITVSGPVGGVRPLVGGSFLVERRSESLELVIPAGELAVLAFPEAQAPAVTRTTPEF